MIRTLNEDKMIVQELSLALFPDFAFFSESICAGSENVSGEVTTGECVWQHHAACLQCTL